MRRGKRFQRCQLLLLLGITIAAMRVCQLEAQTTTISPPATQPATPQPPRHQVHDPDSQLLDIYDRTLRAREALEHIRLEMGKPQETRHEIGVSHAEPHEVFYQALTFFHQVNRLSFELMREQGNLPEKPVGSIRLTHVGEVVDTALERLQRVIAFLGSNGPVQPPPRETTRPTASDVFRSIVQANRQINLLLDRQFTPSDVFQQVTLAVGYTAQLRTRFPGTRMPETPAFEPRKLPIDVYHRLVENFARIRTIMAHSDLKALMLDHHPEAVTASDTYDIAALIVSELSFLHTQSDSVLAPPEAYYPGRKFPSEVYQRVGVLEALLIDLQTRVQTTPSWLQAQDEKE